MKKLLTICIAVMTVLMMTTGVMAESTIKIAVVEPLSGNFKDIGDRYLEGVHYAAKVANENGGLLGKKVEIIPMDSELKPAVAVRKATKLIMKDGVNFFVGGTGSSVGGAMSVLANKKNAIMLSYGMAATSLTGEKCSRNFFRACATTDNQSYALAHWVADQKFKKVFCIAQDYSFGKQAVDAFVTKLKELNPAAEIVGTVMHPVGTKDFAPYVSQIIASGAEVVFTSNWGNDLTLLLKQAKPLGLKAQFACYYLNDENAIRVVANDEAVIGSVTAEIYMVTIPTEANKKFVEQFKKSEGRYPTWLRGKAYLATTFLFKAIEKAGSTDVDKVITAWEGLVYEGPAGKWTMRACDHQTQMPIWIAEIIKNNPYFEHAYVATPEEVASEKVSVPCDKTGCPGFQ
ncbi:MAG: ABC transporter substrate-binding protein [Deltaproteobacteria bacterium]|nr:ABC transporter substrate-binding protein [Deltaproteobacteria bacterium]